MKLTLYTDAHMLSKQVETKFEMLLEKYNPEKLILFGMPLEKLPLNCDGLPLIVQKIYDYIVDYGLHDECLFDDVYSNNVCKENIMSAYELVTGSDQNCRQVLDVDVVDVATVLVMWLYYLPEPLVSSKQFSMICDLGLDEKYQEILSSMNNVNRQTLKQVITLVDSYEKQHKSYKNKLENLFMLLLTKHEDSQDNALQFIDNLKTVFLKAEIKNDCYTLNNECSLINKNHDNNIFKNNLCNKKNLCGRFWSDDGLQLNLGETVKCNALMKTNSCNLESFFSEEENLYNESFSNSRSFEKDNNSKEKCADKILLDDLPQDSSIDEVDESMYSSQIDDMRSIERIMPTHPRSTVKRDKKKSIRSHADNILKSGFLSGDDSLLLQNTLELMKILSKIKNVQNQICIQRRNVKDVFGCEKENGENHIPELYFLNNRLEQLIKQKNDYLSKTGHSYGRLYNRTVLSLKNAQKEAFKLHEDQKNNKKYSKENMDKLISDIYNIQVVLDYLENNCGGKELPWRSSKGCPGHKRKTKKQLNCVTVVSDLQTISEHEVMETIPQPLFITVEHSD